jgi:DNA-binding protein H-NS
MADESIQRMMEIILQMRINLRQVTETFQLQTHEIRQQLEAVFEEQKKGLQDCLSAIDEKLTECAMYIEDYKKLHATLSAMREKLSQLGAEPAPLPPALPADQIEGVIAWRLQELRAQGKA